MPRWEYVALSDNWSHEQGGWKRSVSLWGPNLKEQKLEDTDPLTVLNWLGAEGWELVQVAPEITRLYADQLASGIPYQGAASMVKHFWLKRPIQ